MAEPEIDPLSGRNTTGHEWDGIKELDNPVPDWWIKTFLVSILCAIIGVWLYPGWSTPKQDTKGALGWTAREQLARDTEEALTAQAGWRSDMAAKSLSEIEADPELRQIAMHGGRLAFARNCAVCHGASGGGQLGQFPSLVDDDWLWGGRLEDIQQTITHGIRDPNPDARISQMPSFGALLSKGEIDDVARYVRAMADKKSTVELSAMPGAAVFAANCAACHGPSGEGGRDFGAPRLDDAIWLYGGSFEDIRAQVTAPRHGLMPAFGGRLDPETIKMLSLYVHGLGGGER